MMFAYLGYTYLEAKRQWRNREALIFRLGLPTAIYLILTATSDGNGTVDAPGLTALPPSSARLVALAALGALISGLAAGPALGEERASRWLRQLRVMPLQPSAAVVAKMVVAMTFALPSIALVVAAASVTEGNALGWEGQIEMVALMWVATLPLTALGTVIGLALAAEAAQAATTLAFLVLWLLGGIFTSPSDMPDVLATIAKTLPSHGVVQVGWSAASGDPIPVSAVGVLTAWTAGAGALAGVAWHRIIT